MMGKAYDAQPRRLCHTDAGDTAGGDYVFWPIREK